MENGAVQMLLYCCDDDDDDDVNDDDDLGTTDDFATSFLHFSQFSTTLWGLAELQACPFPDVVFPPLPLSALSSSPFHCAQADTKLNSVTQIHVNKLSD